MANMRVLKTLFFLALLASPAFATTVYLSQSGGVMSCNGAAQSTTAVTSATWTAGNAYYLCGTITSPFTINASGTSASPITVLFDTASGANISPAALSSSGQIKLDGESWITINGQNTGVMQSTANGTSLANQVCSKAISAENSANITVENLTIENIYVHVANGENSAGGCNGVGAPSAVYFSLLAGPITINNVTCTYAATCFNGADTTYAQTISNNSCQNFDHCFAAGIATLAQGKVNTSGTAVTWVSGMQFVTAWVGQPIIINGTTYTISTVPPGGTSMTLTTSAGTQSGVTYNENAYYSGGLPAVAGPIYFFGNNLNGMEAWDSTGDDWHHDGIHLWGYCADGSSYCSGSYWLNSYIYNNVFKGDPGANFNSWVFLEMNNQGSHVFNNVFDNSARALTAGAGPTYLQGNTNFAANNTFINNSSSTSSSPSALGMGGPSLTDQNNAMCNVNLVGISATDESGQEPTSVSVLSNNYYMNPQTGGSANSWNWKGATTGIFSTWVSDSGETGAGSNASCSINTSTYAPNSGSPVIGAGANLYSLCNGQPNPGLGALCSDAAGNLRPSGAPWTVGAYNAQSISQTGSNSGLYAFFNSDNPLSLTDYSYFNGANGHVLSASNGNIAGITIVMGWANYDSGTSSTGPVLNTTALNTLDSRLCGVVGGTYSNTNSTGATCTGALGSINFRVGNMTGSSPNTFTPSYTFASAWTSNALCQVNGVPCSHDQSFCSCVAFPGTGGNTTSCNTQAGGADNTSAPSVWEPTHVSAYLIFLQDLIQYYSAAGITIGGTNYKSGIASLISYMDIGTGGAGQATLYCYTLQTTGSNSYPSPLLSRNVWSNPAIPTNYHSTIYGVAKAQAIASGVSYAIAGSFGNGTNGGGTPPTIWQDDTAQDAVALGMWTGNQSVTMAQPTGNIVGWNYATAAGAALNADSGTVLRTQQGAIPVSNGRRGFLFQPLSPTDPSCVDTPATCNQSGSLVQLLNWSSQHFISRMEVAAVPDLVCAYITPLPTDTAFTNNCNIANSGSTGYGACGGSQAACQTGLQNAISNFAANSPQGTSSTSGSVSINGATTQN